MCRVPAASNMPRMQRHLTLALLGLSALLLAPSCFLSRQTSNVPLRHVDYGGLEPGATTATQVVAQFGAPTEIVQLARRSAYLYHFDQRKVSGLALLLVNFVNTDVRQDRVWLFFDEEDVLTHVGTTFEANDARYAMPWFDIHEDD